MTDEQITLEIEDLSDEELAAITAELEEEGIAFAEPKKREPGGEFGPKDCRTDRSWTGTTRDP